MTRRKGEGGVGPKAVVYEDEDERWVGLVARGLDGNPGYERFRPLGGVREDTHTHTHEREGAR